jgi:transposase
MTTSSISLEEHTNEVLALKKEIAFLKEQLAWFTRQVFGQKADKFVEFSNEQQLHFAEFTYLEEAPSSEKYCISAHERSLRKAVHGQDTMTFPENLPVERHILDIPEKEKKCSKTGKWLVRIGEEVSSKLAYKPGNYFIKQLIRPKYAFPGESEKGILVAELPESLLTRCQADESLLADILVKKFGDHLPLYRQSEIFTREHIHISRQTLSHWVLRVGHALKPLYDEMRRQIIASGNVFFDETPLNMLSPGKGKVQKTYMWVLAGGKGEEPVYRIYDFQTNRKHENAENMLEGYNGILHSDKYGAYKSLASQKKITWCPCWAHIRRKFVDAETGDPPFRKWVLQQIRYLFMLEKVAWARSEDERLWIRQNKEVPIIDQLIIQIKEKFIRGGVLPRSKLSIALGYFYDLIPYLKNYCEHAWARLDNNVAERAVRPLAIGRKNWLFVGNKSGGEAAGVILSLVQTCRAVGANPREYLEDVMKRLMMHNSQKVHELLPDLWLKARTDARS